MKQMALVKHLHFYNLYQKTLYIVSVWAPPNRFESTPVANPKDKFSRDEAQVMFYSTSFVTGTVERMPKAQQQHYKNFHSVRITVWLQWSALKYAFRAKPWLRTFVRLCEKPNWTKSRKTLEPWHDKTNKMSMHPAKTRISLGIRPVWSESSLSAWRATH